MKRKVGKITHYRFRIKKKNLEKVMESITEHGIPDISMIEYAIERFELDDESNKDHLCVKIIVEEKECK